MPESYSLNRASSSVRRDPDTEGEVIARRVRGAAAELVHHLGRSPSEQPANLRTYRRRT